MANYTRDELRDTILSARARWRNTIKNSGASPKSELGVALRAVLDALQAAEVAAGGDPEPKESGS